MADNDLNTSSPGEEEYEVEAISDHRVDKKGNRKIIRYLIKWVGYSEAENTWEKEDNVHAEELIRAYWSQFDKRNPDRLLFEYHQKKNANPILLNPPPPQPQPAPQPAPQPRVATVIATTSSRSPPSSPILRPTEPTTKTGGNAFSNFFTKKPRVTTTYTSSSSSPIAPSSEQPQQSKITSLYKPTESDSDDDESVGVIRATPAGESRKDREKEGTVLRRPTVINNESSDSDSDENDEAIREDSVQIVKETTTHRDPSKTRSSTTNNNGNSLKKRTRSTYTDYFTLEHNRKRKRVRSGALNTSEEEDEEEEEEEEDEIEDDEDHQCQQKEQSLTTSEGEDFIDQKATDNIIFDEAFDKNLEIDWNKLADKVEYIGREVQGGPIYCAVKWKDDVRTFHSIDLVRTKRPDLVIDAFLKLVYP